MDIGNDAALVVLGAGPTGTGKTTALFELFVSRFPRRVTFDFVGEVRRKFNPDAIEVYSYEEFLKALRVCARGSRWHIAVIYDPDGRPELAGQVARVLNPPRTSDDHRSFSRAVGGVAIDCSEADFIFPNGRTDPAVRGLAQRGRHNRVALLMATHAPALVDTRLRDAAGYYLAFRSQEDVVWRFWQRATSGTLADVVATLPPYHCGYIVKAEQRMYVLDERRAVTRVLDYAGAEL
jgi:hypothetical protein